MTGIPTEFRTTQDILEDGVTLILFSEGDQVLAEVIGPGNHEDAVMEMPAAIGFACGRLGAGDGLAILDDEALWQAHWGRLLDEKPALSPGQV
ncbi:hypothetical protein [Roseomonas elaeocarpi]|uniref:Uncharacterized protein n=1 Tax=Roseomonas elaeocarpi TaxID=907779 RepID=A0ABV6JUY0_9PROT